MLPDNIVGIMEKNKSLALALILENLLLCCCYCYFQLMRLVYYAAMVAPLENWCLEPSITVTFSLLELVAMIWPMLHILYLHM